ncbi:MAG: hypothetical protein IT367_18080 [Candidatus Hydrogenedentes bacterium]|nr:hypothetical protein [Candidatus Hydrogenedentota bacterium]
MRHRKQSPQLEREKSYWAIEIKHAKEAAWELHPLDLYIRVMRGDDSDRLAGLKWIALHRKRARQLASDLRKSQKYYAVRAIKLQRITRA